MVTTIGTKLGIAERKAREFARREEEILQAALALCAREDWESVTVEEIAQQSEIGKGTIYKHFESKDAIYARLATMFHRRNAEALHGVSAEIPLLDRFREMVRRAWDAHLSSREMHRVFTYCSRDSFRASLPEHARTEMNDAEALAAKPVMDIVVEGVEKRIFRDKPPEVLIFGARAAFWGAIQIVWSGYLKKIDRAQYLDELVTFMLAGLVRREEDAAATVADGAAPRRAAKESTRRVRARR